MYSEGAVLFFKKAPNKYWFYYTPFKVFNWKNQGKSVQTGQARSTTCNPSEHSLLQTFILSLIDLHLHSFQKSFC